MAQTVANLADVLREAWTQDRLEKQFYDENPLLERFEKFKATVIGKEAKVPIHKGRSGGYSVKPAAGGTLNAADEQKVDQAVYTLAYHWFQISIETGAINQSSSGNQSVADALDLEVEGAVSDMRKQVQRQIVGNGDALIALCATGGSGAVCNLAAAGYGYDALVRGWLYPGLLVDVGTTANEVAISDGIEITAVSEVEATPSITLATTPSGEDGTHYVSIKDARSGTTSYEMNGLRQIAGSSTLAVGGLDADTAGEEFWKPATVDATTTTISLDLLLNLQKSIHQKVGHRQTLVATSLDQFAALESILQNQVRFTSPDQFAAGNAKIKWGGSEILAVPDIPDREIYCLTPEDFLIITGEITKPTWASELQGTKRGLQYVQGATNFVDSVTYPIQLGVRRRNSHASAITLTA